MESRVVILCNSPPCEPYSGTVRGTGEIMASQDFSSASGINGYFVSRGKWSPNLEFFVYTLTSSGGHSPWHRPIGVYTRRENRFATVDDLIGSPIISEEFKFTGPHTLTARTWGKEGQPGPMDGVLGSPTITISIN